MEVPMTELTLISFICVIVIAIMALYLPVVHIRLSNRILKHLENIEANTRK
jgi:hypothetical protein